MDPNDPIWYLKKHDETDREPYGPASLEQLKNWAIGAKISPLDRISNDDQKTWRRAPMVSELRMDWLVEVSADFLYGPTTFGTIEEFIAAGEISETTKLINCRERFETLVGDMPVFVNNPRRADKEFRPSPKDLAPPSRDDLPDNERLIRLEELVLTYRRALEEAELRYQKLRLKFTEATGQDP